MRKIVTVDDLRHNDLVVVNTVINNKKSIDYATLHAIFKDGSASLTRQHDRSMITIPKEDIIAYVDYNNSLGGVLQDLGNYRGYFIKLKRGVF